MERERQQNGTLVNGMLTASTQFNKMAPITSDCGKARSPSIKWP